MDIGRICYKSYECICRIREKGGYYPGLSDGRRNDGKTEEKGGI